MEADTKTIIEDAVDDDVNLEDYIMIHSKYVPSSKQLNVVLQEVLGKGGFEVEVCIFLASSKYSLTI